MTIQPFKWLDNLWSIPLGADNSSFSRRPTPLWNPNSPSSIHRHVGFFCPGIYRPEPEANKSFLVPKSRTSTAVARCFHEVALSSPTGPMLFYILDTIPVPDSQPKTDCVFTIDTNRQLLFGIVNVLSSENRRKTANKVCGQNKELLMSKHLVIIIKSHRIGTNLLIIYRL